MTDATGEAKEPPLRIACTLTGWAFDGCHMRGMMALAELPTCAVRTRNGELRFAIDRGEERMLRERRRVVQRARPLLIRSDVLTSA
jgi:hypothetical protein